MPNLSKRRFLQYTAAAGAVLALSACGGGEDDSVDIVERLSVDPQFSLLVEAVQAAGLVSALKGSSPQLTVFAPTNDAFVALLGEIGLTKDAVFANTELLQAILTYHVIGARVPASGVPLGDDVDTLQGSTLRINRPGGRLVITDAQGRTSNITFTDLNASNGVIHRIDRVLLPTLNIVQQAQITPSLSILVEAVVAAGLVETLSNNGPFTVFAPTNDAFVALLAELSQPGQPPVTKQDLLARDDLAAILTYHVLDGEVRESNLPGSGSVSLETLQGQDLTVVAGTPPTIQDAFLPARSTPPANIIATDINCSNGVVHVIDKVILPNLGAS